MFVAWSFSANLGFIRKSPRSRASSFSWHTLVSKCQTLPNRWFIHLGMGSWRIFTANSWYFHGIPTQQCAKTISFSVRVPVLSEKTKLTYKASDPGIHLIRSMTLFPYGQTCPISSTRSAVLAMAPNFVLKNSRFQIPTCAGIRWHKTQVDSAVLSSFIWGSLLIWNPKTSFTWIRKQNSDGWCKTSPVINHHQAIIKHHQASSTNINPCWHWCRSDHWTCSTSWRAGAPGNLEEDVKTDRNDLVENDPATHRSKSVFKLLHYAKFVETCWNTGSSENMS